MKAYLDSEDSCYNNRIIEPHKISANKRDNAGIGAIIFTFTVISIVIGLSIYTAWQIAYGQGQNQTGTEEMTLFEEMERYYSLQPILNYCYEHADSANPVQDLRDKGLLDYSQGEDFLMNGPTTYYNYTTCAEVKQESDRLNDYAQQQFGQFKNNLTDELNNNNNTDQLIIEKLDQSITEKQNKLKERLTEQQNKIEEIK